MPMQERRSREVLEASWDPEYKFTAPNWDKYPHQWLWDSCFHALSWSRLGDRRCVAELDTLFSLQLPNGFVPNVGYHRHPLLSLALWRHKGRSDITQPPMYGHALRVMSQRGFDVSHLLAPATAGLAYLFRDRRDPVTGLIRLVHPWESGADDSPRWDSWWPGDHFSRRRWNPVKTAMAHRLRCRDGSGISNPMFEVCSVGFSALVAFNARELATLSGDRELARQADELVAAIERRWSPELRTWIDAEPGTGATRESSSVRTLDALLPVLVSSDRAHIDAAFAEVMSPEAFWHRYGPASTDRRDPSYQPEQYWRGDAWPQMQYLLFVAAERGSRRETRPLADALVAGAARSGMAERWNPDTGRGLGAIPQAWTTVAGEAQRWLERNPPQMGLSA